MSAILHGSPKMAGNCVADLHSHDKARVRFLVGERYGSDLFYEVSLKRAHRLLEKRVGEKRLRFLRSPLGFLVR